jgi:spore coat protein B
VNNDMWKSLVGKTIKVDRGGPESRIGKLMAVLDDHLVLLTKDDGVIYYNTHHVKSVTENSKDTMDIGIEVPENFEFKSAANFQGLLDSLKFQWVRINRGGPEKLEGVISEINKDFLSLISKEEVVRVSMWHIRNISYGLKIESENKEESKDQGSEENTMSQTEKQVVRQRVVRAENSQVRQ